MIFKVTMMVKITLAVTEITFLRADIIYIYIFYKHDIFYKRIANSNCHKLLSLT